MAELAAEYREKLVEMVVELDDDAMMAYLDVSWHVDYLIRCPCAVPAAATRSAVCLLGALLASLLPPPAGSDCSVSFSYCCRARCLTTPPSSA